MLDWLQKYDVIALNFFRMLVDPSSTFQVRLVGILGDLEVFMVIVVLIALWLYGVYKKNERYKHDSLMIFYSISFAFLLYVLLSNGLPMRPRPETMSAIRPLIDHLPDNSFPSGHATFAGASILAAFIYARKWLASILCVFGVTMILSRVIAGVHYPGDILMGFLLGMFGAWVVYTQRNSTFMKKYLLPYPTLIAKYLKL